MVRTAAAVTQPVGEMDDPLAKGADVAFLGPWLQLAHALARFRETGLYNDYYRRVGLCHAMALPPRMDDGQLVSFAFNRGGADFTDRERALLDSLRRPLAALFARAAAADHGASALDAELLARHELTPRESEVLQWVSAGKTDRNVAALLGCSPRTVHKHLQRIYTKLGIETRTAAVMRGLGRG